MNMEVEIRNFITREKYEELLSYFKENATLIKDDNQEIWYYDCEEDLRIQVCLDNTKGYGYIIELEQMSDNEHKLDILKEIKAKLSTLNVDITPKEEFTKQYEFYKANWQKLI